MKISAKSTATLPNRVTTALSATPRTVWRQTDFADKFVELRFFGRLSVEETAEVLKISPQSVMRDWKMARASLMAELAH